MENSEESIHNERKNKKLMQHNARISGKNYTTYKNIVKSAIPPPSNHVMCSCKYDCKVIVNQKATLFQTFHEQDMNRQGSYLLGLIDVLPVKRRRHGTYDDPSTSRRQSTIAFTIPDETGKHRRVCKRTFIDTFGITSKRIETIVKKKKSGKTVYKDMRGGKTHFKFLPSDREQVKEHIRSIPTDPSHYNRHKSEKQYLSSDLNIHRLWRAFLEKYTDSQVTYKFYRQVFSHDFPDLAFRKPRVDTCKTCDRLNVLMKCKDKGESPSAQSQLEVHHRKAEAAFQNMKNDSIASTRPDSDTCTITIDLQKVFQLPQLSHSNMYYSRQLGCYNFGIHVCDTGDGIMCLWHEGESSRGGNQMASCVLQAVNDISNSITYKNNLCVWSDNCCGQIKNRMMLFLYMFLVATGQFKRIDHKFLMVGHSFSASDRDFAIIEKRWKVSKCQVPDDVSSVITSARPVKPFKCIKMGEKFFNFDQAASRVINTKKLKISEVVWLRVESENPGVVKYKKTFSALEDWSVCSVLSKNCSVRDIAGIELELLIDNHELTEAKKKDLLSMVNFIDEKNRAFYSDLCA